MSAITVTSPIPASVILVSDDALNRIDALTHRSALIAVIDEGDESAFIDANDAYKQLHALSLEIEKTREQLKAPVLDFGRQLDAAAKGARQPIELEKDRLGALIKTWQNAENRKREEAARLAREEAARLQREADERAEAERLAAFAKAQREAADATPPGEDVPIVPEPVFVEPAPIVIARAYIPPPVKSAVRTKVDHVLVIEDRTKIPHEIAEARLFILDEALCTKLLKQGLSIPGLRLDEITGTSAAGWAW